jgi:hypothetical protein
MKQIKLCDPYMMSTNEYFNILACCRTSFSKFVKVYGQIHKLRIFRVKTCPGRTSPTWTVFYHEFFSTRQVIIFPFFNVLYLFHLSSRLHGTGQEDHCEAECHPYRRELRCRLAATATSATHLRYSRPASACPREHSREAAGEDFS